MTLKAVGTGLALALSASAPAVAAPISERAGGNSVAASEGKGFGTGCAAVLDNPSHGKASPAGQAWFNVGQVVYAACLS